MKALSLKQPWLDLIILGHKTIETRKWKTKYRGPLLLCASKTVDRSMLTCPNLSHLFYQPQTGVALCMVELADCRLMKPEDSKAAMCDYEPGRFAWIIRNVRKVKPFDVKGQLGLFEVDDKLIEVVE